MNSRKVFYDTEFYEDGERIDLISIGMVDDLGNSLYLENSDFNWDRVPPGHWLHDNVRPHLSTEKWCKVPYGDIGNRVRSFLYTMPEGGGLELWGYYPAYDHVALAQLFGTMMDLPKGLPMFTMCLKQEMVRKGITEAYVPNASWKPHNALEDALMTQDMYYWIEER